MTRLSLVAGLCAMSIALAGCSDDGGSGSSDTPSTSAASSQLTVPASSSVKASSSAGTQSAPSSGNAGDSSAFCAAVKAVKELSVSVGLGPGSVPGADELQQIRDAQAAIVAPGEIAEAWAKNLKLSDETIALSREAEAAGKTAYDSPYLDRALGIAERQAPSAATIETYVVKTCGFSTRLG